VGTLTAGCSGAATFVRGLDVACLTAGFAAGFVATAVLAGGFLGFRTLDFPAVAGFDFVSRAAVLAAAFPAVPLAVVGLRAGEREDAAFFVAPFAAARLVPEPVDRAGFVSLAAFG
jgi:hypothetical protein